MRRLGNSVFELLGNLKRPDEFGVLVASALNLQELAAQMLVNLAKGDGS
jgi:hypothetical protein